MKKAFILFLYFLPLYFSAQTWEWAKNYAHPNPVIVDNGNSISRDKDNNLYVTGYSYMPQSGPNTGWAYSWLKKFDAQGNFIWSDTIPFINSKTITDEAGNTYIIGTSTVGKYDTNGNLLWIKYIPSTSLYSISFLHNDLIIAGGTGSYTSSIGTTTLAAATGFLVKCDIDGNWLWVVNKPVCFYKII